MKGKKTRHADLKILEGKARSSNAPKAEPLTGKWITPRWLPKYAKEFVKRYRKPLQRANVLSSWDYDSFLTMACLASEIKGHYEALTKDGWTVKGRQQTTVKHPRVSMLRAATQQFRLYAESFGLTPRGRCGLNVKPMGKSSKMSEFID